MRRVLFAAALTLAACGNTAQPSPSDTAKYPFACDAIHLGGQGRWAEAQHRWLSAQQSASSDAGAVAAFILLNLDTAMLAEDQLAGASQTADLATYTSDLSGDGAHVAGC